MTGNGARPRPATLPTEQQLSAAANRALRKRLDAEAARALTALLDAGEQAAPEPPYGSLEAAALAAVFDALGGEEGEPPLYPDVAGWVEHHFAPTYIRRATSTVRWCTQWWQHPEAIIRFTALWQTWEAARLHDSSNGMADWLIGYLDRMLPVLLGEFGPFYSCTPDKHTTPGALAITPAPPGFWESWVP